MVVFYKRDGRFCRAMEGSNIQTTDRTAVSVHDLRGVVVEDSKRRSPLFVSLMFLGYASSSVQAAGLRVSWYLQLYISLTRRLYSSTSQKKKNGGRESSASNRLPAMVPDYDVTGGDRNIIGTNVPHTPRSTGNAPPLSLRVS